jgi:hypothetical protein
MLILFVFPLSRKQITDDESVSMQLLLGYIGLLNAVCVAPAIPILVSNWVNIMGCLGGAALRSVFTPQLTHWFSVIALFNFFRVYFLFV